MRPRVHIPPRMAMLTSFASMSIINYAFSLLTGWLLVPGDFGLLAFAQTLLTISGLVLNSGFAWSLTAALVHRPTLERGALIRGAAVANLLLAMLMSSAILALFILGPLQGGLETPLIAGIVALSLPPMAGITIVRATAQGLGRFHILALVQIVEVIVKAAAGLILMLAGFGATGAIAGFLVGGVIASTLALWLMVRVFMLRVRGPMQWPALKMAGGMFGALTGMALLLNLDIIALKLVSGADRALVGQYQAAIVLANTPYYLAAALLPIFFTQAAHLGDIVRTSRLVGDALRLALLVLIPIELVFVAAPEQVLAMLFPATYAASATPLRILALGNCALIVVAIFSSVFQATDKARVPASILIGVAVSEVIALGLVVPTWHAAGAALTFLIAATCALAILLSIYTITVKGAVLRPAMRWLIRYGSALGLGTLVGLMALRLEHGTVGALILGGLSYGVCALCLRLLAMPGLSSGLYPLSQVSITEKDDSCVSSI